MGLILSAQQKQNKNLAKASESNTLASSPDNMRPWNNWGSVFCSALAP